MNVTYVEGIEGALLVPFSAEREFFRALRVRMGGPSDWRPVVFVPFSTTARVRRLWAGAGFEVRGHGSSSRA